MPTQPCSQRFTRVYQYAFSTAIVASLAFSLSGCAVDSTEPRVRPVSVGLEILDGRNGGSSRFFFRPPIAPSTPYTGEFDSTARPLVRITQWSPPGRIIAQFSDTSATPVKLAREEGLEHYLLSWRSSTCNVGRCETGPGRTYRILVLSPVTFVPYGWADVMLVRHVDELGSVPPGVVGVVYGQVLPIRFRIEKSRVKRVSVQPVQSVMDIGRTQTLTAIATDSAGLVVPNVPVTWSSSAAWVAPVSSTGTVVAVFPGSTVIQATMDGVSGHALVTAEHAPALRVVPARAILPVGQQLSLAAFDSAGGPAPGVIWFAPDPAIAAVSASGIVTGLAPGVARIRALTNTAMYEALITVQGVGPQVNVMPPRDSLLIGQGRQLVATDRDGVPIPSAQVQWSSTDVTVAPVSLQGMVTGVSPGLATIQATVGILVGQSTIVVVAPFSGVPPSPLQPMDSVRVRQDDPASGCTPGQGGFAFQFQWNPGSGLLPRIGEHFQLTDGNGAVVIDTPTGLVPATWWGACGFVVPDHLLDGWSWRVRTAFSDASFGPWGPGAPFGFLPSSSSPNMTSFPLDYGPGKSQVSLSGAVDAITSDSVTISIEYRGPSGTFYLPPQSVEFYRFSQPRAIVSTQSGFYSRIGTASYCGMTENGITRSFRCPLGWNPGPSDATGTYPVVATVRDPNGSRFVGAFLDVTVVP